MQKPPESCPGGWLCEWSLGVRNSHPSNRPGHAGAEHEVHRDAVPERRDARVLIADRDEYHPEHGARDVADQSRSHK